MASVKRELMDGSDGSDGEPKLEIADHPVDSDPPSNQDAVESLLLLGRQPVVSSEMQRQRAASLSSSNPPGLHPMEVPIMTLSRRHSLEVPKSAGPNLNLDGPGVGSYYQKMRERNNEASKRCRLKRRMKAVSMENQSSMLNMANKMLKQRIKRLEHVGAALKEGVDKIRAGQCACENTKGIVRQTSRDYFDPDPQNGKDMACYEVISKSKQIRENNGINFILNGGMGQQAAAALNASVNSCSSEEDFVVSTPNSPINCRFNITPPPLPKTYKTALDVINETIVKTLDTPLNLVKTSSNHPPKQLVLLAKPPLQTPTGHPVANVVAKHRGLPVSTRQSVDRVGSSDSIIKVEPTYTEAVQESFCKQTADSSTPICIANSNGASLCRGEVLNLNKLTCYLDLITRKVVKDDGESAMERAIIKSRLKIPFWSADETALFICGSHRSSVVHGADLGCCAMCSKRRSVKKARMMPMSMYTITYRMSLEYYTCTGNVLPIGLAVCSFCREKHLKSVDLSNSKIITIANPVTLQNGPGPVNLKAPPETMVPDSNNSNILITSTAAKNPPNPLQNPLQNPQNPLQNPLQNFATKVRQLSTASTFSNCSSVSSTNGEVQILLTPVNQQNTYGTNPTENVARAVKTVVPVSSSSSISAGNGGGVNNFKISRLNDALQAINPRYQPIGFSITSVESCSPSVLQDAISAAETGVYTLLSVIAPGQESQIWETIRPCLDRKLTRSK